MYSQVKAEIWPRAGSLSAPMRSSSYWPAADHLHQAGVGVRATRSRKSIWMRLQPIFCLLLRVPPAVGGQRLPTANGKISSVPLSAASSGDRPAPPGWAARAFRSSRARALRRQQPVPACLARLDLLGCAVCPQPAGLPASAPQPGRRQQPAGLPSPALPARCAVLPVLALGPSSFFAAAVGMVLSGWRCPGQPVRCRASFSPGQRAVLSRLMVRRAPAPRAK